MASNPSEHPSSHDTGALQAEELDRFLGEISALLEKDAAPELFYRTLVEKTLQVTGGAGAAIWQRDSSGRLRPLCEKNLHLLELDKVAHAAASHTLLLENGFVHARTFWVGPHEGEAEENRSVKANLSPCALLLAPIVVEKRVVGMLEILFQPEPETRVRRQLARLGTELSGLASAFVHKTQWQKLQRQQRVWQQIEDFAARVHDSLDPDEIAYIAANDGKKLLDCDQVSIALSWGRTCRVAAVSGAVSVARRSPLVKALSSLANAVSDWGEPVSYEGSRDLTLPPPVLETLDAYLALSNSRRLSAAPLTHKNAVRGVLIAESFEGSAAPEMLGDKIKSLQRHLAPALANAVSHRRLPLRWLSVPLASCRDSLLAGGQSRLLLCLALVAVVWSALTFVQLPLRSEATGRLVPRERRIVYAHVSGKVVQMAAQNGDRVDKGQELLFVEDLETQLKADQLLVRMNSLNQKIAYLDEQLSKSISLKERSDLLGERIRTQYEASKARIERNLLVAEYRNPRKAPVTAPVAGQVLTFDAQEKLLGKTVKLGDPLLRLANVNGTWEVELFIPERAVGRIRQALRAAPSGRIDVDLLLSSDPHRVYQGTVSTDSLGGETTVQDSKVVLPATVHLGDQALTALLEGMPVGVEVQARIRCGHASAGYVCFSELWDFLYERFLF